MGRVNDEVADGQVVGGDVVDDVAGGGFGGAGEVLGGPGRQVELVGGGDRGAGSDVGDDELGGAPGAVVTASVPAGADQGDAVIAAGGVCGVGLLVDERQGERIGAGRVVVAIATVSFPGSSGCHCRGRHRHIGRVSGWIRCEQRFLGGFRAAIRDTAPVVLLPAAGGR